MGRLPARAARMSSVRPRRSRTSSSAPASTSSDTHVTWSDVRPYLAARTAGQGARVSRAVKP